MDKILPWIALVDGVIIEIMVGIFDFSCVDVVVFSVVVVVSVVFVSVIVVVSAVTLPAEP